MTASESTTEWPPGLRFAIAAAVLVTVFIGWETFWFLTDDAFIAFRYASNAMRGWGLVWNPPPFEPVEGYTSFLWVVLLTLVWRLTDLPPPETANVLSLSFGYLTLFVVYKFVARMRLPTRLQGHRPALLVLVLVATISNRTFLTWLSSGLETALFNFCLTWWLYEGTAPRTHRTAGWGWRLCCSATLVALARPGGLLAVLATPLLLGIGLLQWRSAGRPAKALILSALVLVLIPAHFLWRYAQYEQWLPNTYYAKHVAAWPESGLRYAASFLVEYGAWVWLLFALLAAGTTAVRSWRSRTERQPLRDWVMEWGPAILAVGVLVAHAMYYTLVIGGDHFEYRVYSYSIPLLFLSGAWLLSRITVRPWAVLGALSLFVLLSYPIPWTHWAETHHLDKRATTQRLIEPVADDLPAFVRPLAARWDAWQRWLIVHHVCMRHQEHKIFHQYQRRNFPSREVGAQVRWEPGHPVKAGRTIGMVSWVLPEVAIIDKLGLNDRVVARQGRTQDDERRMGHDRAPPDGYVSCFRPNVRFGGRPRKNERAVGPIRIRRRDSRLTEQEIRECQRRPWR